jgi:hypothetical protein
VENQLTEVLDVAWANSDSLLVLGSTGGAEVNAFTVSLAQGAVVDKGGVAGAVSIAAAPGQPFLMSSTDGKVYAALGVTWLNRANGVSPAYPN